MARKLPGLQRVLETSLAGGGRLRRDRLVALLRAGRRRLQALGLHAVGAPRSSARSSCSSRSPTRRARPRSRRPGGAATFVRRAFNDQLGFLTGWALFLDYLIVIALAALFVPHYFGARARLGRADGQPVATSSSGSASILVVAARRASSAGRASTGSRSSSPASTLVAQLLLDRARAAARSSRATTWRRAPISARRRRGARSRSRSRWRCSPTRASRPSRTSRRRRASPARRCRGASSSASARPSSSRSLIGDRRALRVPGAPGPGGPGGWASDLGTTGSGRRSSGIAVAFDGELPGGARRRASRLRRAHGRADPRRRDHDVVLGRRPARVLARQARHAAARRSARLNRRTLISPAAIVATAVIAAGCS